MLEGIFVIALWSRLAIHALALFLALIATAREGKKDAISVPPSRMTAGVHYSSVFSSPATASCAGASGVFFLGRSFLGGTPAFCRMSRSSCLI